MSAEPPDLDALRGLAGKTYWQRGESYHRDGCVDLLHWTATSADAEVSGSELYRVVLRYQPQAMPAWGCACSCPLGEDGEYCKHVVATALAWTTALAAASGDEPKTAPAAKKAKPKKPSPPAPPEDLPAFLRAQPASLLAAWLMELADSHTDVHRQLLFRMRSSRADTPQSFRKALGTVIGSPGFLDWRSSNAYARRLGQLVDLLNGMCATEPAKALDGCEYALGRLLKIYANSDDSGGAIGERLHELAELHAQCCTAAQPDAVKLAAKLLKLQCDDDWALFAVGAYREALGETGLDAYGAELNKRWQALPAPPAARHGFDSERFAITRLMEQYCEARGDVEGLLKVKTADLSAAHRYADVIDCCLRHGRQKAALDWAERGVKAFKSDPRLRATLAAFYERDGFAAEALPLRWQNFADQPKPEHFLALRGAAGDDWPDWRGRALSKAQTSERAVAPMWGTRPAKADKPWVDLRLQLHLAEDRLDDALALANTGLASPQVLQTLARRVEAGQPDAAVALYDRIIPALLDQRTGRYDDIVALIYRRAQLVSPAQMQAYDADLRQRYRAKRNLIKLLDETAAR